MLTGSEKNTYRKLLYWAMLDIRLLGQPRAPKTWNPISWHRLYLRGKAAGELADWLHNLALFAISDFEQFDTERFWSDYIRTQALLQKLGVDLRDYRAAFIRELERLESESPS